MYTRAAKRFYARSISQYAIFAALLLTGCDNVEIVDPCTDGHNLPETWTVQTPATCLTNGEERRTCQRVNCEYYEQRVIDALNPIIGHILNNNWVRTGFYPLQKTSKICSVCSASG